MAREVYNSDAVDTDNDGMVQDGTIWERPVDAPAPEEVAEPVNEEPEVVVEEVKAEDSVIVAEEPAKSEPAIENVQNDVIGASVAEEKPKPKKAEVQKDKVALFSEKNVFWEGVGSVGKGYNIVDAAAAEKWLNRNFIRLATPEEIKQEFGK